MKSKKRWFTYLGAALLALLIAFFTIYFEIDTYGTGSALLVQFISDGFFTSAMLFLGCGGLALISETGNFYGIQYLGYTLVHLFSFRKERFDNRKDYFTYCTEKEAKQKEKGKNSLKWALLYVGIGCLIISVVCAVIFYQMA